MMLEEGGLRTMMLGRGRVKNNGGVNDNDNNDFISIALFHAIHARLCWEEGGLRTMMLGRGRVKDNDGVGKREG